MNEERNETNGKGDPAKNAGRYTERRFAGDRELGKTIH